jgi:hypothetical protein
MNGASGNQMEGERDEEVNYFLVARDVFGHNQL